MINLASSSALLAPVPVLAHGVPESVAGCFLLLALVFGALLPPLLWPARRAAALVLNVLGALVYLNIAVYAAMMSPSSGLGSALHIGGYVLLFLAVELVSLLYRRHCIRKGGKGN